MKRYRVAASVLAAVAVFSAATGCGGAGDQLTEEKYIEIIASWNVLNEMHRQVQLDGKGKIDPSLATWITDQFMRESDEVLEKFGVTYEDLKEFEHDNPRFISDPENKQKIIDRINELIREQPVNK